MSYDVYLGTKKCKECGHYSVEVDIGNYTSNVSPMWTDALGGVSLKELEDYPYAEAIGLLDAAVEKMRDPANIERYKAMEPLNKWGNYEGAAVYLTNILTQWRKYEWLKLIVSC